jgi:hypothetical protein
MTTQTNHKAQLTNANVVTRPERISDHGARAAAFAESMKQFESGGATSPAQSDSQSRDGRTDAANRPKSKQHPVVDKPEFCLVVVPSDDLPTLEIFADVASLTRRVRSLEGQESHVFPFFGVPLPFTAGSDRFLRLPDGQPYPIFDFSGYGQFVADSQSTFPADSSYFLGDDKLTDRSSATVVDHRPAARPADGQKVAECGNQDSGPAGHSDADLA